MRLRIHWGSIRNKIIVWAFVLAAWILVGVALVSLYAYQDATEQSVIAQDKDLTQLSARVLATALANHADPLSDQFVSVFDGGIVVFDANRKVLAVELERTEGWGTGWDRRIPFRRLRDSSDSVFSNAISDGVSEEQVFVVVVPMTDREKEVLAWLPRRGTTERSRTCWRSARPLCERTSATYSPSCSSPAAPRQRCTHCGAGSSPSRTPMPS